MDGIKSQTRVQNLFVYVCVYVCVLEKRCFLFVCVCVWECLCMCVCYTKAVRKLPFVMANSHGVLRIESIRKNSV